MMSLNELKKRARFECDSCAEPFNADELRKDENGDWICEGCGPDAGDGVEPWECWYPVEPFAGLEEVT